MRPSRRKQRQSPLFVEPPNAALPATSVSERTFADLYAQAFPLALSYAVGRLPPDGAEDVVEGAAVRLFEEWDQLPLGKKTVNYFLRAVMRDVVDEHRREMRRSATYVSLDDEAAREGLYPEIEPRSPLMVAEQRSEYEMVCRIVESFPPRVREVWTLCREYDLSPRDAGELLGLSSKTVRNHLARGAELVHQHVERMERRLATSPLRTLPAYRTEVADD